MGYHAPSIMEYPDEKNRSIMTKKWQPQQIVSQTCNAKLILEKSEMGTASK